MNHSLTVHQNYRKHTEKAHCRSQYVHGFVLLASPIFRTISWDTEGIQETGTQNPAQVSETQVFICLKT